MPGDAKEIEVFVVVAAMTWALLLVGAAVIVMPLWWVRSQGEASDPHGLAEGEHDARPSVAWPLVAAAVWLLVNLVLLLTPRVGPFTELAWNWQGKLLAFAASLALVAVWSRLRWRDVGVTRPSSDVWVPVVVIATASVAAYLVMGASIDDRGAYLETLLFQATMPGLEEELLFRGILWALIDRALPGTRRVMGARLGWAFVITTLLFGLGHGVAVDGDLMVSFSFAATIFTGMVGFALGWVRARSGSIIPAIVLHNLFNVALVVLG